MALLLETTLGDIVIDLDVEGSPDLCKSFLKLAKARYFTSNLVYNVDPNRFFQAGDPHGDGTGGACIYGVMDGGDVAKSSKRFLKSSSGRPLSKSECQERGRVVATEINGIPDTIGSQFLITIGEGPDMALDGYIMENSDENDVGSISKFRSIGVVSEDDDKVLEKINDVYCDPEGRPFADVRIKRALIIDDPFEDPPGMDALMETRGIKVDTSTMRVTDSPDYVRPPEEKAEIRIGVDEVDPLHQEEDEAEIRKKEEESLKREDHSRAVVLEMLGDLPSADIVAPENVLFVCKLNPVTEDEDLELIFSRFDEKCKAEIIRDPDNGNSLQYAFIEFTSKEQATNAYLKMDNTLVDDRRIKVDFSQSVAKIWNKYSQKMRPSALPNMNSDRQRGPQSNRSSGRFGNRGPDSRPSNRGGLSHWSGTSQHHGPRDDGKSGNKPEYDRRSDGRPLHSDLNRDDRGPPLAPMDEFGRVTLPRDRGRRSTSDRYRSSSPDRDRPAFGSRRSASPDRYRESSSRHSRSSHDRHRSSSDRRRSPSPDRRSKKDHHRSHRRNRDYEEDERRRQHKSHKHRRSRSDDDFDDRHRKRSKKHSDRRDRR